MRDQGGDSIRGALAAVWDAAGRSFVTVEDADDEDRFVQYIDGQLNVAWPFDGDPAAELRRRGVPLPDGVFTLSCVPGGTAVLAVGDLLLADVAGLMEDIVERVLGARDITIRVDRDR